MRRKQGGGQLAHFFHNAGFGQCLFEWYRVSYECTRCHVLVAWKRNSTGNRPSPDASLTCHTGRARSSLLYQNTQCYLGMPCFQEHLLSFCQFFRYFSMEKHSTTVTRCAVASCQARRRSRCAKTAARAASRRCRRRCWPGWC